MALFEAVLLGVIGVVAADLSFLLLHNNDMHARFLQTDRYCGICEDQTSTLCYGGFARLHSEVVRQKQEAATRGLASVFLNAGDTYQGTPFYTLYKWHIVAPLIDMLGIDVMCLGNHEFDDSIEGLVPFINNVSTPIVCSNLNISGFPELNLANLQPSRVLTVNGTKVGVIGYLTPQTQSMENTGGLFILDEISSIRLEAQRLLSQNVSILIALGHSGYSKDQEIAYEVEEIDLVVGGHTHTFLYNGTPPDVEEPMGPYPTVVTQASGKQVPVVQAYYATKYLGYLELEFDDAGNLLRFNGTPILLSGDLPQDKEILKKLEPYAQNVSALTQQVLGYTDVVLDGGNLKCKIGECNIGNLITDAYVDYVTRSHNHTEGWTLASIGLIQAGGIRASINTKSSNNPNGSITLEHVMTVTPWGDLIAVLQVTGSVLLEALEYSVSHYEDTITGHVSGFLQVSGIHVVYDISQPSGQRVVEVSVLCANCSVPIYSPLQPDMLYGVVLPDYLVTGGDNFQMFKNKTLIHMLEPVDYMVVAEYIKTHSPIYTPIEGRITILNYTPKSAASAVPVSPFWTTLLALATLITYRLF